MFRGQVEAEAAAIALVEGDDVGRAVLATAVMPTYADAAPVC